MGQKVRFCGSGQKIIIPPHGFKFEYSHCDTYIKFAIKHKMASTKRRNGAPNCGKPKMTTCATAKRAVHETGRLKWGRKSCCSTHTHYTCLPAMSNTSSFDGQDQAPPTFQRRCRLAHLRHVCSFACLPIAFFRLNFYGSDVFQVLYAETAFWFERGTLAMVNVSMDAATIMLLVASTLPLFARTPRPLSFVFRPQRNVPWPPRGFIEINYRSDFYFSLS